jgi:hypothetical protein
MMNKLLDLVGMIGNQTVIDSLLKYDKISHEPIFLLAHPKRPDTEEKHQVLAKMKESEQALLYSLGKIL